MGRKGDAERAWSAESLRRVRLQMLNGERPEACLRCFREEDSGLRSPRLAWNLQYPSIRETATREGGGQGHADRSVKYLDLRFGNLCNLKCRMCNPYSSHKWLEDWETLNGEIDERERHRLKHMDWFESEEFWENLKPLLGDVDQIYMTGGEPMLSQAHLRLLDYLVETRLAQKITVKYNTNLTVLPPKVLARWPHFKEVRLNCSLDGVGMANDYIRYPSNWSEVETHLRQLDRLAGEFSGLQLTVHFTFQALNALELTDTLNFMKQFRHIKALPYVNVLNHPEYLNVRVLPTEAKREFGRQLEGWLLANPKSHYPGSEDLWTRIQDLPGYVNTDDMSATHLHEFREKTVKLDGLRGTRFTDALPRLGSWL